MTIAPRQSTEGATVTNRRLCVVGTAAAAFCTALVLAMPLAPAAATRPLDELSELVAPMLAATACVVAGRRKGGRARTAWYLIAAGAAARGAGQGAWCWLDLVLHQGNPFPSIADAGFAAAAMEGKGSVSYTHLR